MKTILKFIPVLLFGIIVGGLFAINVQTDPLLTIACTTLVMALFSRIPTLPVGALGTLINPGTYNWTGKDVEEILFRPNYIGMAPEERGFRIVFTAQSKIRLHFLGKLGKILMPYTSGWAGGNPASKIVREFIVSEFKAEVAYDKHDYDGMMYEIFFQDGIKQNDIDATVVMQAEQKVFQDALKSDIIRQFWLGDTSKVHIASGTYPDGTSYAIGDPDKYYNQTNGVLKQIFDNDSTSPTSSQVKKIDVASDLSLDSALGYMKLMVDGCTDELREVIDSGEARFYATRSWIRNYRDTLTADGTEAAHSLMLNGSKSYTYDGIPILPLGIDAHITNDFDAATFPQDICILTTPQNLAAVLNASDTRAAVRMWFNPDANERRQRAQFKMTGDFVLPELVTIAYHS